MAAALKPCRALTAPPIPTWQLIRGMARHRFSTGTRRLHPSNVGNVGLAERDTIIGKQAAEPLTLNGIKARREKAGKLVAPTASYSDSDMFKSPVWTFLW
jgi:hypothetical protein